MHQFASILFFICLSGFVFAQEENEMMPGNVRSDAARQISNTIYGKLIDELTGRPIQAASVQLYPGDKARADSLIDGMLSKSNGEFRFEEIPVMRRFRIVITAIGYESLEDYIQFNPGAGRGNRGRMVKDMGNIRLEPMFKELENVTVQSGRPALQMGIDRKIFNVEKSLLASGGTAVDVMKNIPSVSVDIDGNIELRNSSPQIFVDGRPTILTLDQIAADQIEKVELITNPSAKYDASGSAGIINIVLKKNKRIGLNGLVSLSAGTPSVIGSNLNINLRQGKFNFFASAGLNHSGGNARGETFRQNKRDGVITDYFNQLTVNERSRRFNSIRFGTDYFISNRSTLRISQNLVRGRFGNNESQQQEYLDKLRTPVYYGIRSSDSWYRFDRQSTGLNYTYKFPKAGKTFSADFNYNHGTRGSRADILNEYATPDGRVYKEPDLVLNEGDSRENRWTFQADFSNPITEDKKIETGIRSDIREFSSVYEAYALQNGMQEKLPLSNSYAFTESVNAAYVTFSEKREAYSYQLGLRTEIAKFDGELLDSAFKFGYQYPNKLKNIWDALFPSFFITKKLGDDQEVQLNYSRRIRRPRFWQLSPFITINDPVSLRQGNPQLQPEFINSFEFNYSHRINKGNLLAVLYYRNNPRDITPYSDTITVQQFQQLDNAAIDPNAILSTYINAGVSNRYGAELTLQYKAGDQFDITPTVNLQYRKVKASVKQLDLSNEGFNWEAKLIVNYKLQSNSSSFLHDMGFQLIADYESPRVIPQGKRIAEFDVDVAIRKDFLKDNKASVTFAVNDVFNSRRWGAIYDTERFYQDAYRRWRIRTFRVTFSYKFGNKAFMLFGGGSRGGR